MAILRNQLLLSVGGDTLAKYGTLVRRYQYPPLGGETLKETFSRSTTATYWDTGLNVRPMAAAINVPRVEWLTDPVSGIIQPYLKLEAGATNSVLQSQAWGTTWTATNLTGTINNQAAAPDGTTTASSVVPSTTSSAAHGVSQTVTVTAGEYLAFSCYLKANGYSWGRLTVTDNVTNGFQAWFDLGAGTITALANSGSATISGQVIVKLANGWYWLGVWGKTGGAATSWLPVVNVFDSANDATNGTAFAGNGTNGLLGWGANFERNGTTNNVPPTSYIVTTTATVTRGADVFSVPWYAAPGINQWIYMRFLDGGIAHANGYGKLFNVGSVGVSPAWTLFSEQSNGTAGQYGIGLEPSPGNFVEANNPATPAFQQAAEYLTYPTGTPANYGIVLRSSLNQGADVSAGGGLAGFALPTAWSGNILSLNGGPQAGGLWLSRLLVGLGAGTNINVIADARAVPV